MCPLRDNMGCSIEGVVLMLGRRVFGPHRLGTVFSGEHPCFLPVPRKPVSRCTRMEVREVRG